MSEHIKMLDGASPSACRVLKGLLNRDAGARLGAAQGTMFTVGGIAGLKRQEFFLGMDWAALERKEIDQPGGRLGVEDNTDLRH